MAMHYWKAQKMILMQLEMDVMDKMLNCINFIGLKMKLLSSAQIS